MPDSKASIVQDAIRYIKENLPEDGSIEITPELRESVLGAVADFIHMSVKERSPYSVDEAALEAEATEIYDLVYPQFTARVSQVQDAAKTAKTKAEDSQKKEKAAADKLARDARIRRETDFKNALKGWELDAAENILSEIESLFELPDNSLRLSLERKQKKREKILAVKDSIDSALDAENYTEAEALYKALREEVGEAGTEGVEKFIRASELRQRIEQGKSEKNVASRVQDFVKRALGPNGTEDHIAQANLVLQEAIGKIKPETGMALREQVDQAREAVRRKAAEDAQKKADAEAIKAQELAVKMGAGAAKARGAEKSGFPGLGRKEELEYLASTGKELTEKDKRELLYLQEAERALGLYGFLDPKSPGRPVIGQVASVLSRTGGLGRGNLPVSTEQAGLLDVVRAHAVASGLPTQEAKGVGGRKPVYKDLAGAMGASPYTTLGAPRSLEGLQMMALQRAGLMEIPVLSEIVRGRPYGYSRQPVMSVGVGSVPQKRLPGTGLSPWKEYMESRRPRASPEPRDVQQKPPPPASWEFQPGNVSARQADFGISVPELQALRAGYGRVPDPLEMFAPQTGMILGSFNKPKAPAY